MRVMIKTIGLCLFIGLTLLVQDAMAILPDSTYGIDNGWQGYKFYKDNGYDLLIPFNVYDTQCYPSEFIWDEKPAGDRYIYAYQIASHKDNSTKDVAYFSILDIKGNPVIESLMHGTTALDDLASGIAPDPYPSEHQGVWEWSSEGGYISAGQHSWFLIFSSEHEPVQAAAYLSDGNIGVGILGIPAPIPEPGTFLLLGLGALMLRRKRGTN